MSPVVDPDLIEPIERYFAALQYGNYEELRKAFTSDASGAWGPTGSTEVTGVDAIVGHLSQASGYSALTFVAATPICTFRNDELAEVRTRAISCYITAGTELVLVGVEYDDVLVRSDRWRIKRRDHRELWRAKAATSFVHPAYSASG